MSKRPYLPKHERTAEGVKFALTERDVEILHALNRCRYLTTGQVSRLLFGSNQTNQSARRRLKYLYHNQFIGRIRPLLRIGEGSGEITYYLDRRGREELIEGEEVPLLAKAGLVGHQFLAHALAVAEFRVVLELALREHPAVALASFIADFEIRKETEAAIGHKIYKLYEEVFHPLERKRYVVYPDALFVLQGKGEYEKHQKLYLVEIDRGTEGFKIIKDKITGYRLYRQKEIYQKYGAGLSGFVVLLQTSSETRAQNLRRELSGFAGAELVWIATAGAVSEQTVLSAPIWLDCEGNRKSILRS